MRSITIPVRDRHPRSPVEEVIMRHPWRSEWFVTLGILFVCAGIIAALNM